jgi:hypothetical protein
VGPQGARNHSRNGLLDPQDVKYRALNPHIQQLSSGGLRKTGTRFVQQEELNFLYRLLLE